MQKAINVVILLVIVILLLSALACISEGVSVGVEEEQGIPRAVIIWPAGSREGQRLPVATEEP